MNVELRLHALWLEARSFDNYILHLCDLYFNVIN